jgi:hypothetical protein
MFLFTQTQSTLVIEVFSQLSESVNIEVPSSNSVEIKVSSVNEQGAKVVTSKWGRIKKMFMCGQHGVNSEAIVKGDNDCGGVPALKQKMNVKGAFKNFLVKSRGKSIDEDIHENSLKMKTGVFISAMNHVKDAFKRFGSKSSCEVPMNEVLMIQFMEKQQRLKSMDDN